MEQGAHVTEQLPGYALGCLEDDEAAAVARHLETCAVCRTELAGYYEVSGRLAWAVPVADPPAWLKARLVEHAQSGRQERLAPAASWGQRVSSLFRPAARAWGAVALVLAVLLIASNVWWWQRAEPRRSPAAMRAIALLGTEAAPGATGTLVTSPDGEYGTLVVDGLPLLDRAHAYQLWLIRDGQRSSGGLFNVNGEGYGALVIDSAQPLSSFQAFGVTVEPAGGSQGPTGDRVLGSAQ